MAGPISLEVQVLCPAQADPSSPRWFSCTASAGCGRLLQRLIPRTIGDARPHQHGGHYDTTGCHCPDSQGSHPSRATLLPHEEAAPWRALLQRTTERAMEEKPNPNSWGTHHEQSTATRSQSLRSALSCTSSHDRYRMYRSHIPLHVSHLVSTGIHSQQPPAQQDQTHHVPVSVPLGKQDPEWALPYVRQNINSMMLPGPEKTKRDLSVTSKSLSQVLKPRSLVGRCASQETYIKYRSHIPV